MKWLFPLVAFALMTFAIWRLADVPPPDVHMRTVAFDNTYGGAERLAVHVKVDDGAEQAINATCDSTTCRFELSLTNARHVVALSVEQDGKRSTSTQVTLDTGVGSLIPNP